MDKMIESKIVDVMEKVKPLGLYIHIPFCVKKCDYCDFLSAPATEEMKKRYVDALITEIKECSSSYLKYEVQTIFFGGGTPSSLKLGEIERIMEALSESFQLSKEHMEVSIEVNPGTLTREKLSGYKKAGINRLSFGLQSANDRELKLLGRIHTYQQFKENYLLARSLGYTNINVDLMSALPEQTLDSWEQTLRTIIALEPEHISAYSLIVEEDTPFYERYSEGAQGYKLLPDEETDRSIYHHTKEILKDNRYDRYEISNYAKPGFECRHNSSYWIGTDYLGLGLGASSLIQGVRFTKEDDLQKYIMLCEQWKAKIDTNKNDINEDPTNHRNENVHTKVQNMDTISLIREPVSLTLEQRMEEFMFLGLRMSKGISKTKFKEQFNKDFKDVYSDVVSELVAKGLIEDKGDRVYLTEIGVDVSNYVLAEFLLS